MKLWVEIVEDGVKLTKDEVADMLMVLAVKLRSGHTEGKVHGPDGEQVVGAWVFDSEVPR